MHAGALQLAVTAGQMGAGQPHHQAALIEAGIGHRGHGQPRRPLRPAAPIAVAAHRPMVGFQGTGEHELLEGNRIALAISQEAHVQKPLKVLLQPQALAVVAWAG